MTKSSIETFADIEALEGLKHEKLLKTAKELAPNFDNLSAEDIKSRLVGMWGEYLYRQLEVDEKENAGKVRIQLRTLAKQADELISTMLLLGQGAVRMMNLPTNQVELARDADPSGLPARNSTGGNWPRKYSSLKEAQEFNWWDTSDEWRGGRWVIRLHALSDLAKEKADQIKMLSGKGGRKSFVRHLGEQTARDWLAQACAEFVEANGCKTQTVAAALMRAVIEVVHGRKAVEQRDVERPSREIGRKAVRKATHSKPKKGPSKI